MNAKLILIVLGILLGALSYIWPTAGAAIVLLGAAMLVP